MTKADKLKVKQIKRRCLVDSMRRIQQFAINYKSEQELQLSDRFDRLIRCWELFLVEHDECVELDEADNAVENESIVAQAEEIFFSTKAALSSKIAKAGKVIKEDETCAKNIRVKLPTIALPEFGGELTTWLSFHDTFVSLVHNCAEITPIQKFHYLRASLKAEAAGIVQPIPISAENYQVAWKALLSRYDNKVHLRKMHTRALFSLQVIKKSDAQELRQLVNQFQLHIDILKQLGETIPDDSTLIVETLASKLDKDSLQAWEENNSPNIHPTYPAMITFLLVRAQTIESLALQIDKRASNVRVSVTNQKPFKRVSTNTVSIKGEKVATCPACNTEAHPLLYCPSFLALTPKARQQIITDERLCANCFRSGHFAKNCQSRFACKQCKRKHHTLLHFGSQESNRDSASSESNLMAAAHTNAVQHYPKNVLLSTVLVHVADAYGQPHLARALLDSGSQPNAMSERLCQQLRLPRRRANVRIVGVDGAQTVANFETQTKVHSRITKFSVEMNFLVLRKVACDLPTSSIPAHLWSIPASYQLADPHFSTTGRIDMIIGAAHFYDLLFSGRFILPNNAVLVETVFGWLMTGDISLKSCDAVQCNVAALNPSIEEQLERFWKTEELQGCNYSFDEKECERHFLDTVSRDNTGRYIVQMPKQPNFREMIGESKSVATRRFNLLEKRLKNDANLKAQYHEFMREYLQLEHMAVVPLEKEEYDGAYYLPHHPVMKESSSTTKVRVVFDASTKTTTGNSLNDALLVGPVVQEELLTLVLRFRKYRIAVVADIEKMYRQVSMHPSDRHLQRILWRFDSTEPIRTYELGTVTYGLAPSAFLATRTLVQLANDEGGSLPKASAAIKQNLYVDDLLAGADSSEEAIELREQLHVLLEKGGFCLRKWCSNSLEVLANIPSALRGTQSAVKFEEEESIKTLGICWEPEPDTFRINIAVNTDSAVHTKRSILSTIAQLYDPLGLITPVTIRAKIFMQQLWLLSLDWDTPVPPSLHEIWNEFLQQVSSLSQFRIDRFAFTSGYLHAELHCFADASEAAYGACIYIRSTNSSGLVNISLLTSKSRVAPLKPLTIPRLELSAALLGARLYQRVLHALDVKFDECCFWSDSTTTIRWLKAAPRTWKTFVANRVAEIQELTHGAHWQHVSGKENPADMISRGIPVADLLTNDLWRNGPSWLRESKSSWPVQPHDDNSDTALEKRAVALTAHVGKPESTFDRFSSFRKLVRVYAFCLRFVNNIRNPENRPSASSLLVDELQAAKKILFKMVQTEVFSSDLRTLGKGQAVNSKSPLRLLNPFIDASGLIRVGGRLRQSNMSYGAKHPILLPAFHPVTRLLIMEQHHKVLHGGVSMTLSTLREEVWILNGMRAVRSVLRTCYRCIRANPSPIVQPVGQLPASRVTVNEVFACVGIDYCGPLYLRPIHRKAAPGKCYICVFVCMSTKAIHLELVTDLSTPAFLMALDRFVSRRGKPKHIYSDNGTNFIGAKNALHEVYLILRSDSSKIADYLAKDDIQWHLIPPRAPNFGGLWEAAVKVAKNHLVRQLGTAQLSYEAMSTILAKIERCMNSRPLMPISQDPNDLSALTPAHFLLLKDANVLPEADLSLLPLNRLSQFQYLQRLAQNFWQRWQSEYLQTLNTHHKIGRKAHEINIGDLVIMKDEQLPAVKWPLARIIAMHPGPDGVTRVVTLRTASGIVKRPVSKISALEAHQEE